MERDTERGCMCEIGSERREKKDEKGNRGREPRTEKER